VRHSTLRHIVLALGMTAMAGAAALAAGPATQTYKIDPANSSVGFSIRHLISRVQGQFDAFSGEVQVDAKDPAASSVSFTIRTASIDTHVPMRDKDLRSAHFFDAARFPTITFKSTKMVGKGKGRYDVYGTLTMHGVAKDVVLPVVYTGKIKDPWGNERLGFAIETTLARKAYGITWNKVLDDGSVLLGDDVAVTIHIEAVRPLHPRKKTK